MDMSSQELLPSKSSLSVSGISGKPSKLSIAQRQKWLHNHRSLSNSYFWGLYTGAEIDYVEESQGEFVPQNPGPKSIRQMYNY